MMSLVVASGDKVKRQVYIQEFCTSLSIFDVDAMVVERETQPSRNIKSIGIEDVKNIHKRIYLKPIRSKVKAVIIEDAHTMTVEAQNSMLKILEEPPLNTVMILSVESAVSLLPTIISRCRVIEIRNFDQNEDAAANSEAMLLSDELIKSGLSELLKIAEDISKDKDKTISLIRDTSILLRKKLIDNVLVPGKDSLLPGGYLNILRELQGLYFLLKSTNVNTRMALEMAMLRMRSVLYS